MKQIMKLAANGELSEQDVQDVMTIIHANSLRDEKVQLEELSDAVYGHVDRRVLEDIQSRIDEINDWLSHLEYV